MDFFSTTVSHTRRNISLASISAIISFHTNANIDISGFGISGQKFIATNNNIISNLAIGSFLLALLVFLGVRAVLLGRVAMLTQAREMKWLDVNSGIAKDAISEITQTRNDIRLASSRIAALLNSTNMLIITEEKVSGTAEDLKKAINQIDKITISEYSSLTSSALESFERNYLAGAEAATREKKYIKNIIKKRASKKYVSIRLLEKIEARIPDTDTKIARQTIRSLKNKVSQNIRSRLGGENAYDQTRRLVASTQNKNYAATLLPKIERLNAQLKAIDTITITSDLQDIGDDIHAIKSGRKIAGDDQKFADAITAAAWLSGVGASSFSILRGLGIC